MKSILFIFLLLFSQTAVFADESWKNIFGICWRGTADENLRYSNQMGYDHIIVRQGPASLYTNNPNAAGLKFFIDNPRGRVFSRFPYGKIMDISRTNFTQDEINFYENNMVWKSYDPFPNNLASGWWASSTTFSVMWDFQQQAVIDVVVDEILELFRIYVNQNLPFTFAGYADDVPHLTGDFNIRDTNPSGNRGVSLSYWTGTDSCLVHDTITHEYPTYQDGVAAYYKQLNTRMRQEFPGAKWVMEPTRLYSSTSLSEYIYRTSQRSDRDELTPDLMLSESGNTEFVDNNNNFNSGMNITKGMVGISQPNTVGEAENRLFAAKAGINGAWYNWYGRWGGGGSMPDFQSITEVYPRLKLIRCVPNWDNLNGVSLGSRSWDGSVYQSGKSYISSDVMYSEQPTTGKIFAVFTTIAGQVVLPSGKTVATAQSTNTYFEESGNAIADFVVGNNIIDIVDSVSVPAEGLGYIFTTTYISAGKTVSSVVSAGKTITAIVSAGKTVISN